MPCGLHFTRLPQPERDINWDMKRLEGYRNFCNKIWNAARYVLMNTEEHDCGQNDKAYELSLADKWIVSQNFKQCEAQVEKHVSEFRLDLASQALYDFIWNEYCDWYLELSKPILTNAACPEAQLIGTRRTLVRVLEAVLRLAHPFLPFITEEIWQRIAPLAGKQGDTIMTQAYPAADQSRVDEHALGDIEWLKGVIVGIRNIRGEMDISPGKPIPVFLHNGGDEDKRRFESNKSYISALAKLESMEWLVGEAPLSATQLVGSMEVLVPMAGLIDVDAEVARLTKELDKASKEIGRLKGKLNNEKFVGNAPEDVVAKEKSKLADAESSYRILNEQVEKIKAM